MSARCFSISNNQFNSECRSHNIRRYLPQTAAEFLCASSCRHGTRLGNISSLDLKRDAGRPVSSLTESHGSCGRPRVNPRVNTDTRFIPP